MMNTRIHRRAAAVLALVFACTLGFAQDNIRQYVNMLKSSEPLKSGVWGIKAETADGRTIAEYNSEQKMTPASNTKLLTTGTAIHSLGSDFKFETKIAYTGTIKNGVLDGDLYIVGGGDPTIGAGDEVAFPLDTTFARWMKIVTKAGIREIRGSVVGDGRFMKDATFAPWWEVDDFGWDYGAVTSGLNFNRNVQSFSVKPGAAVGANVVAQPTYPIVPWMDYRYDATTSPAGNGDELTYEVTKLAHVARLAGRLAIDRGTVKENCTNRFSELTCAYYFRNYLIRHGVVCDAYSDNATAPQDKLTVLGSSFSPSLADIIYQTNRISDNFYAETLLLIQGQLSGGSATYDAGQTAEKKAFGSLKVDTSYGIRKVDGSGLARANYISPDFFVRFLKAMMSSPEYSAYLKSLPQPGKFGTLDNRVPQADAATKNRIHAKSGSMNGVRCYSGYITAKSGKPEDTIIFSFLTNNVTAPTSQVSKICDEVMFLLSKEN